VRRYNRGVDGDLERIRRVFEGVQEFARTYRFEMTDEYRAMIAHVEAMPQNQSGADKSGRWLGSYAAHKAFFDDFSLAPRK
jgi:hypothetical protein